VQDIEALIRLRHADLSFEHLLRLRDFIQNLINERPSTGHQARDAWNGTHDRESVFRHVARKTSRPRNSKSGDGAYQAGMSDDCSDGDDLDKSIAVDEARVCEFVLGRKLELASPTFVKSHATEADLSPAVQGGTRLPRLRQARFESNFEFCRALALPFLDEVREELLASLEAAQFKTSPVLGVTLEDPVLLDPLVVRGRKLRKKIPDPLECLLSKSEHEWLKSHAKVSTVDGFQGKECDVIAISCVRTGDSLGFVKDPRRLNVAVTRAKLKCWIFGNLNALERGAEVWRELGTFARERRWVFDATPATQHVQSQSASTSQSMNTVKALGDEGPPRCQRNEEAPRPALGGDVFAGSDLSVQRAAPARGGAGAVWQALLEVPLREDARAESREVAVLGKGRRCIQLDSAVLAGGLSWIRVQAEDGQGWVALEGTGPGPLRQGPENFEILLSMPASMTSSAPGPVPIPCDPFEIFFTHNCIGSRFRNGTVLDDAIRGILESGMPGSAFPPMCVTRYPGDGRLYSLSNRRLFLFRVISNYGVLQQVNVHLYPFDDSTVVQRVKEGRPKWVRAFTTRVDGRYAQVVSDYFKHQWPRCPVSQSALAEETLNSAATQRAQQPEGGFEHGTDTPQGVTSTELAERAGELNEKSPLDSTRMLELGVDLYAAPRKLTLQVQDGEGAGLDLCPTRWGMLVVAIEEVPGQPGLAIGDTITGIGEQTFLGIGESDVAQAFGHEFCHGAEVSVVGSREEVFAVLPRGCHPSTLEGFSKDLNIFAEKLGVEACSRCGASGQQVIVCGPTVAFKPAHEELGRLLSFDFPC